jgi:HAD superfamily hydrolase (TIGR01509 family)
MAQRPAAILDIDGTLVDSNYHHTLAWFRAFAQHGFVLPLWRVHRAIGKGGDHMVADLVGGGAEEEQGNSIRSAEKALYLSLINEVRPFEDAHELIVDLKARGHPVVLASSAKPEEVDHYLTLLDARELADAWTTSGDVRRTKPDPDLVTTALKKVGGGNAVMIGDSVWDCIAAKQAGIPTFAVLTGGFSVGELEEAGAAVVFESIAELRQSLDDTPLG